MTGTEEARKIGLMFITMPIVFLLILLFMISRVGPNPEGPDAKSLLGMLGAILGAVAYFVIAAVVIFDPGLIRRLFE